MKSTHTCANGNVKSTTRSVSPSSGSVATSQFSGRPTLLRQRENKYFGSTATVYAEFSEWCSLDRKCPKPVLNLQGQSPRARITIYAKGSLGGNAAQHIFFTSGGLMGVF